MAITFSLPSNLWQKMRCFCCDIYPIDFQVLLSKTLDQNSILFESKSSRASSVKLVTTNKVINKKKSRYVFGSTTVLEEKEWECILTSCVETAQQLTYFDQENIRKVKISEFVEEDRRINFQGYLRTLEKLENFLLRVMNKASTYFFFISVVTKLIEMNSFNMAFVVLKTIEQKNEVFAKELKKNVKNALEKNKAFLEKKAFWSAYKKIQQDEPKFVVVNYFAEELEKCDVLTLDLGGTLNMEKIREFARCIKMWKTAKTSKFNVKPIPSVIEFLCQNTV
ncbi:hypothetical protein EIN_252180 [Entamoeba invadens IP1]|uniref:Ras-GEF domain-containing protein n=1 Tax=Entamoeba invadens IP1 TaxID=370355 RepID=A0A0A1UGN7_ENTIV|nr:hypothetical protein EIN_252180 [Entamoeba invadens IP1]ELP95014.1 hypothetical protein EIN_252180 [Entamoeba invadens IP1]|eukprot:XP_004261785.1 hypothetical protein EIN_252180 [Entamoeba invadens IP1]